MHIKFVYQRPMPVLHYRAVGPYEQAVKDAWGALLGWLDSQDMRKFSQRAFGIIHDWSPLAETATLRYDACVELVPGLSAAPELGITRRVTPSGAYAQGVLKGSYGQIRERFSYMCSQWASAENLRVDTSRPFMAVYLNDPATTPREERLTKLCVPIRTEPDPRKLLHISDDELELEV
ncbi:MAG: GyrI-like domain-containing protein [Hyphomicrobiaceae bacterium]